jgi:CubicO group peptidase (beta-lactamase class C family)
VLPALFATVVRVTRAIELVHQWPVDRVAAASLIDDDATVVGARKMRFPLASVTKLLTAMAVLIAVEEGTVDLDLDVAPLMRVPSLAPLHIAELLSHSSGLAPEAPNRRLVAVGRRRIYSNAGYELAAAAVEHRSGMRFAQYVHEAVFVPLAMTSTTLDGSAASGATSTVDDLLTFLRELRSPRLISRDTHALMVSPHHPGLSGILPGFGRHEDNTWGLGPEIRSRKSPHWTGRANSPHTFGHFGRSGSCLWWDPSVRRGVVALTTTAFGEWATDAWPHLADAVLAE